jgi:hypothetical protein
LKKKLKLTTKKNPKKYILVKLGHRMSKCRKLKSYLGRNSSVEKHDVKASDPTYNDPNGSEEILMLQYLSKKACLLLKLIRVRTDYTLVFSI